jgi:hypothetical protein
VQFLHCFGEFARKEDMQVEINAGFGMRVWNGKCIEILYGQSIWSRYDKIFYNRVSISSKCDEPFAILPARIRDLISESYPLFILRGRYSKYN